MPAPASTESLLEMVRKSGLIERPTLDAYLETSPPPADPEKAMGAFEQKLLAHQVRNPTSSNKMNPAIPHGLAAVVLRMLAKNPDDRYQTPADAIAALSPYGPIEEPAPVVVAEPAPLPPARARPRRRAAFAAAVILVAVAMGGLGGWGLYSLATSGAPTLPASGRSAR